MLSCSAPRRSLLIALILMLFSTVAIASQPHIIRHFSIYEKRNAYCAWPAIARAENGDIVVLFTRTEEHMSPNGEIMLVRSTDNGETWLPPSVIYDTLVDDRESGITVLHDGRLLTHLRSVRFEPSTYTSLPDTAYPPELIERWIGYVEKPEYKNATHLHRAWQTISSDNGYTWSDPQPSRDSIHGGIQLASGSLLVASYRDNGGNIGVYKTENTETPWRQVATVECPQLDKIRFGEPHILQLPSGRIVMMIRATAKPYDDGSPLCYAWGTYSDDDGETWAPAYETPLWGFPPHLTLLSDGRVLCTYGHRRPPYGQRAAISEDGVNWSVENEFILRDDAPNKDLGYPVSIELEPGKILTVYYQPNVPPGVKPATHPPLPNRKKPGILGTIWKLPSADKEPSTIQLESRRELFVDDFLIHRLENVKKTLHRPQREKVALTFDKPWEGIYSAYPTVIKDGDLYRMYYRGMPKAGTDGQIVTCYAESQDGITWTKPSLGIHKIHGTRKNNVILDGGWDFSSAFTPFLDTRPGVPESERFKAVSGVEEKGLAAFVSSDGIHWKRWGPEYIITKGMFDSQNVAFWSPSEQRYICYFRTWTGERFSGYRTISRTTSPDFLNWDEPEAMTFGNTPMEHLYTNGTRPYFRAPHIYIALAKRFLPGKPALQKDLAETLLSNPKHGMDSSDAVFMTSRGGNAYDRTFMEAFIRPGGSMEDWVARDNTPGLGIVPGNEREMFLYRMSHYGQPTGHLTRYSMRTDGFASLSAPYQGGEVTTKPFTFRGDQLIINYATSAAGEIRVEIQDADGLPLSGYTLSDCLPIFGDEIKRNVAWKSKKIVSTLQGKPIRLRFYLKDADLFSMKFSPDV